MNPLFVVTAIRAAVRIGHTAADAFEQYAQEKPILIPDADRLEGPDLTMKIRRVIEEYPEFKELLANDAELSKLWQLGDDRPTGAPDAEVIVFSAALRHHRRMVGTSNHLSPQTSGEVAGGIMVGQWAEGKGPVTPWVRIVVAMTDVALEYVGSTPEILEIGGNGEKIIGAVATTLSEAIPDGETREVLGPRDRFAERLAALVLASGLKTVSENPGLVFGEAHLQELLRNVLPPVLDALPNDSVTAQVEWREVSDALLGPSLNAAFGTVAANPTAFLGRKFAAEKAAGVMVVGLLNAAKDIDVRKRFTTEALLALFQAAMQVAAENPELVLGDLLDKDLTKPDDRSKADAVAVNLLRSIATALKDRQAPFGDDLGVAIAVAVVEGLKNSGPSLFNRETPWHNVAGTMTAQVLDGLASALGDDAATLTDTVFSKEKLVDLARIFVTQVAATPHIVIRGNGELERVVSAVAAAMVKDKDLLLTADDWIQIAHVAAQEAGLNPGRLFGINEKSLEGSLAADIIGRLLKAASDDLVRSRSDVGSLMIGDTLREAIIVTLRGIGGNVDQAFTRRSEIESLAARLNDAAAARKLTMGGKEWLRLFRALLPEVLSEGTIPELDDKTIASILAQ